MKKPFPLKRILYSGLGATSMMTLFSYAASYLVKDQFKEPQLLSYFFFTPRKRKARQPPVGGFLMHYLVGMGFSSIYQLLWKRFIRLPVWQDGLSYGAAGSLFGILAWRITFAAHPSPPNIQLRSYLFHLFIAHLIFGVTLSGTDKMLRKKPQKG